MQRRNRLAVVAVAGTCALAGAAAGISQSAASSSSGKSSSKAVKAASNAGPPGGGHPGHGMHGGEVHAVEVVLNKAGTAYVNETDDNGTITAVDSNAGTITLKEGTSSVTYATPTITIPSGASVMLDGETSSLDKLKEGDQVSISSSSEGTTVFATDSSFKPGEGHGPMGGPPPGGQPPSQGW